jgi:amino acid adenylation domain-containing protein
MLTQTTEGYRISPIQRRLWKLAGAQAGLKYRVQAIVIIKGALDKHVLQRAVDAVTRRHEALRTALHLLPGMSVPVQVVEESYDVKISELKLGEAPLSQLIHSFRMADGLQAEARLALAAGRIGEQEHLLAMGGPSMYVDPASLRLVIREIARLYELFEAGSDQTTAPVPQYPDIAEWLNEMVEAENAANGRKHWRQVGARIAESLSPVGKYSDLDSDSYLNNLAVNLDADTARNIISGESTGKLEPSHFVLAAWVILLQKLGHKTKYVGVSFDGRSNEKLHDAVGPLTKYLPILLDAEQAEPFASVIEKTRKALQKAANLQEYFSWETFEAEETDGQTSHFVFCFDYTKLTEFQAGPNLRLEIAELNGLTDQFSMRLHCQQADGELKLGLSWLHHLYTYQEAATIMDGMVAILADAAARPKALIRDLEIITNAQAKLFKEGNLTFIDFSHLPFIHQQFSVQAARTPHAIAVVYEGQKLTYRELNARAVRVAHGLQTRGVGPESLVGICLDRALEMVVAMLGVLKAGAAYVPLDPRYPTNRLQYMVKNCGSSLVLSSSTTKTKPCGLGIDVVELEDLFSGDSDENEPDIISEVDGANPAYVIYTSGSTGVPKGITITHDCIRNHMAWMQRELLGENANRVLQKTAFSFDASVWEFYAPLLTGGVLVMARPGGQADAEYMVKCVQEHDITILQLVPTQLQMMLEQPNLEACRSLKQVFCGGEALSQESALAFYRRLPWAKLYNLYGPSEATIDATHGMCGGDRESGTAPIGKPIANTQVFVLNEEMKLAPMRIKGELYIGGAGLARGYWGRPDLTADRFVPNPFSEVGGERLYKTGDQVKWLEDGNLEFLGRLDHQVKVRGHLIETREIEVRLLEHAKVKEAVLVVREEKSGEKQLVAYVVGNHKPGELNEHELRRHLREQLPEYMMPGIFVELGELPLAPNGKVDRHALPQPSMRGRELDYIRPRNGEEEILCGLYAEVLNRDRVGTEESFFEMGGHSLLATRLISRVQNVFGTHLPLRTLFEAPSVAGLARRIREARGMTQREVPQLKRVERKGDLPLSYAQQRLWFIDHLQPGAASYNVHFGLRLAGMLDKEALRHSLKEIVRRHEVLRTSFPVSGGMPIQKIAVDPEFRVEEIDLRQLRVDERGAEVERLARIEANKPFDLGSGPLLRVILLHLGEQEHVLLATLHHIISDGWSLPILVWEFSRFYEAYTKGEPPNLPELGIQYADYAKWQREWGRGEVLEEHLEYWRKQLVGAQSLELPADRPRMAIDSQDGGRERIDLGSELTQGLKALSRREGVTLFMTLLAAFQLMLARYTGRQDIVVGTDIANRNWLATEELIGFFVNQLVLRTDLSGNPSFRELLNRVRQVVLEAYEHQDLPFEKLVEELAPERNLRETPLFRVKLVLQNVPQKDLTLPGISVSVMDAQEVAPKFDLLVNLIETDEGLCALAHYNRGLFSAKTIQSLLHFYYATLAVVAEEGEVLDATKQKLLREVSQKARSLMKESIAPPGHLISRRRRGHIFLKL